MTTALTAEEWCGRIYRKLLVPLSQNILKEFKNVTMVANVLQGTIIILSFMLNVCKVQLCTLRLRMDYLQFMVSSCFIAQ